MIRIKDIQEAFRSLVGWEQSMNPLEQLEDDLVETESGLYFQGAHPLLTLENIKAILPDTFYLRYLKWNMVREYKKGDVVFHLGDLFIARNDNHNMEPMASDFNDDFLEEDFGGSWGPYNILTDYLRRETDKAIATTLQRFQTNKSIALTSTNKVLLKDIFYPTQTHKLASQDAQGIVGFNIKQTRSAGVSARINRIGLAFTAPVSLRVSLYHSSESAPVKTLTLEYDLSGEMKWFDVSDMYISGEDNSYGRWFIGYDTADLPEGVLPIASPSVNKCCGIESRFMVVMSARYHREVFSNWDSARQIPGINVDVTIGCDITDFLIAQRNIFATAIQLQVATTLLRTMAMNPEVKINANQSNVSRMDILYELDGNTQGYRPGGLGYALKKAYEELDIDTRGIDSHCLPCRSGGIKYRAV